LSGGLASVIAINLSWDNELKADISGRVNFTTQVKGETIDLLRTILNFFVLDIAFSSTRNFQPP
jgi:hypothetical protein